MQQQPQQVQQVQPFPQYYPAQYPGAFGFRAPTATSVPTATATTSNGAAAAAAAPATSAVPFNGAQFGAGAKLAGPFGPVRVARPRLLYFSSRGLAEYIRLMLVEGGVDFEDVRLKELTAEIKAQQPFGQVPVLEIDGRVIPESRAIAWYVARRCGFAGTTIDDQTQIDIVLEVVGDIKQKFGPVYMANKEADKEKLARIRAEFVNNELTKWYGHLETLLGSNPVNQSWAPCLFFAGAAPTIADFVVFDQLTSNACDIHEENKKLLADKFPLLSRFKASFARLPRIQRWISQHPEDYTGL